MESVIEIGSNGEYDLSEAPVLEQKENALPNTAAHRDEWLVKKERGNQAVAEGNLELALQCYTQSMHAMLEARSEPMVAVRANRALVWLRLARERGADGVDFEGVKLAPADMYERCVEDCDVALRIDGTHAKAHFRKSKALHALERNHQVCVWSHATVNPDRHSPPLPTGARRRSHCEAPCSSGARHCGLGSVPRRAREHARSVSGCRPRRPPRAL
jgi:hypothetical protein